MRRAYDPSVGIAWLERQRARQEHWSAVKRGEHVPHRDEYHQEPVNGGCCVLGMWRTNFCETCDEPWPCPASRSHNLDPGV